MLKKFCLNFIVIVSVLAWFVFPVSTRATDWALNFDGLNNSAVLPSINAGSSFSVEAWFYLDSQKAYMTLLKNDWSGTNFGSIFLDTAGETSNLQWWFSSSNRLSLSGFTTNTWYHFVFTSNGSTVSLYKNGVLGASGSYSPNYNNGLEIGASDDGEFWDGRVDDVRLYNRALTAQEVTEHYQGTFSNNTGLVGLWNFNEGSGTSILDSSGQGNNGTVNGATWVNRTTGESAPAPSSSVVIVTPSFNNASPNIDFLKLATDLIWRGKKTISYVAYDNDPIPGGLLPSPINLYYTVNNGSTWEILAKDQTNSGSYELDTTKLPDGSNYRLKVTATDGFYKTSEAISGFFTVDNFGPTFEVKISSPENIIKEEDKILLNITSSENLKKEPEVQIVQEGSSPQSLLVKGGGKIFSAFYSVLKGYIGTANISIKGEDAAGNTGNIISSGKTFLVNRLGLPPPIINSPSNNQFFDQSIISVSGEAPLSKEVNLVLNGTEKFNTKAKDDKGYFVFNDIALSDLNNGYNTISVSSITKEGVESDAAVLKLKLNKAPEIYFDTKFSGEISGNMKFSWLASDANKDELIYSIRYSTDGGKNWDYVADGLRETMYELNTNEFFDSNNFRLKIIADDGVTKGEAVSDIISINNKKTFFIENIPSNYLMNTTAPIFIGTAEIQEKKIISLRYSLDQEILLDAEAVDKEFNSSKEKFTIKPPSSLIDGKYILSIQAKDDEGNFVKTFRVFIVDTLPPVPPEITFPRSGDVINKSNDIDASLAGVQINVLGTAEAGAELEFFINNRTYKTTASSDGKFTFKKVTLLSTGLNRFTLTSSDIVGNISNFDGFIISNNPPDIFISSLKEGEFIGGKKEVKWTASDKDGDKLTLQALYRVKNGRWIPLTQDLTGDVSNYKWDTSNLSFDEYEFKIIANDGLSEGEAIISRIFVDNSAPLITLDQDDGLFVDNSRFIFSGRANDNLSGIQSVEYSFDNTNWYKALITEGVQTRRAVFEFYHKAHITDGDYKMRVRATDEAGNIGYSRVLNFIVDTAPPIIGSNMISSGSLILFPDENGEIKLLKNKPYKISISISKDAKEAVLKTGDYIFPLVFNKSIALWEAELKFLDEGDYQIEIDVNDVVGNSKIQKISNLQVLSSGFVFNENNNERIEGVKIYLYVFDQSNSSWLTWDAASFGQSNPQETDSIGEYGFLIPPGKYYFESKADGFKSNKSKNLEIKNNYLLNAKIPMKEKGGLFKKLFNN